MCEYGIRHTQVAFRILKVNRVHFMRHRTRTDLSSLDFLLEILHRDILPEIAVHINHNGIDALHGIENGTQIIVIGNLSSIFLTLQPQLFGYETISERFPVDVGISHMMRIIVSGSTTELCRYRTSLQHSQLTFQAVSEYFNLFSQPRRRSRLTVSLCQHGDVFPFFGIRFQLVNQFLDLRIIHLLQCVFNRQRH